MLTDSQKRLLLGVARDSIADEFAGKPNLLPKKEIDRLEGILFQPLPCFVTLMTQSGRLRGCIGTLEARDTLLSNVRHYAKMAAFEDPRFEPLESDELNDLEIGISVIGPTLPLRSFEDIRIGKHGLNVCSGQRRGVLLAKVAVEFGWDTEQFIVHTCQKAHLAPENRDEYEWSYFEEESFSEGR